MSENFILDALKFRYSTLLKQEQEIVQGYEDGVLQESILNDYRLEIRFLESELQIKDKLKFRTIENDELVYLSDDEEYDYKDLPVLKTIKEKTIAELKSTKSLIITTKNLENDEIKDLITEPINKEYSWGKYGDFNLIICNKNGYVNGVFLIYEATEFEKKIRDVKTIPLKSIIDWLTNKETVSLFKVASIEEGINENDLYFKKLGAQKRGEEMLQGTYIHPVLINSLATWVSPSYALKINRVINKMNIEKKLKDEDDRTNKLLGIKNDIIAQMERKYNEISTENQILIVNNEIKFEKVMKSLNDTVLELKNTSGRLNNAVGFIDGKKNDIRLTTTNDNIHYFYIYKFTEALTGEFVTYTCYRVQPKNLQRELNKVRTTLRNNCIFERPLANPIQAWIKFKNEFTNKIDVCYSDFTLKPNYNENQLKADLENLFSEYTNIQF
jgi:hypothetical protein